MHAAARRRQLKRRHFGLSKIEEYGTNIHYTWPFVKTQKLDAARFGPKSCATTIEADPQSRVPGPGRSPTVFG
jgi:hypothetical protein